MSELLFGSILLNWGPPALAFAQQHPWRVFAAVLVVVLLMDLMFRRHSGAGSGDFDSGGGEGDGGCGGD
jgi:hypothetical protein